MIMWVKEREGGERDESMRIGREKNRQRVGET